MTSRGGAVFAVALTNHLQQCREHCFFLSVWHLNGSEPIGFFINHLDHNGCMDRGFRELICSVALGCVMNTALFSFLPFLPGISSIKQTTQQLRPKTKKHTHNSTWLNDWALPNPTRNQASHSTWFKESAHQQWDTLINQQAGGIGHHGATVGPVETLNTPRCRICFKTQVKVFEIFEWMIFTTHQWVSDAGVCSLRVLGVQCEPGMLVSAHIMGVRRAKPSCRALSSAVPGDTRFAVDSGVLEVTSPSQFKGALFCLWYEWIWLNSLLLC